MGACSGGGSEAGSPPRPAALLHAAPRLGSRPAHPPARPPRRCARPPQDGINAQWQAWYLSNARYPLKSATLNGTPLHREQFGVSVSGGGAGPGTWARAAVAAGSLPASSRLPPWHPMTQPCHSPRPPSTPRAQFWIHAAPLAAGPATLELEAENGARLTASVASPLSPSQVPNFDIAA